MVRQLASECPDVYNAARQLDNTDHWINERNYPKIDSLLKSYNNREESEEFYQNIRQNVCQEVGLDINNIDFNLLAYNLEFWCDRWKDGDAEWTKNWLKSIIE